MLNVLNRMLRNEFECWNNSIAQSHHHSSLNWMTVLQTCCIFCEFERHKFRFDWRQCKIECLENEIEWQMGCAWPKSSKLNAHKMNLVDKITKLTGKTYNRAWAVADPRGDAPPPPKIGSTMLFFSMFFFFFRMLKNKAQIARESIKTTLELPGPFSGPWTSAESEFGFCARNVRAIIFCAPPP